MKKQTLYFFIFIVITVLMLQQCKKDTSIVNQPNTGYVKEYYTNKPIANAQVGVYNDMNYSQLVENVYTDSNGKFVTNETITENPYILINKQGYFSFTYSYQVTNRDANKNIFWLDVPAYIQTHIKNVNNQTAQIFVSGFSETVFPPSGVLQLQGNNIDTTICCKSSA